MPLPDSLRAGDQLKSAAGVLATVVRTTGRDPEYGTPLYRLRYGGPGGRTVLSSRRWTRNKMEEAGCVLVEPADCLEEDLNPT